MSRTFAVVCEAPADFRIVTELADRVLLAAFDWLEPETLAHQRTWINGHRNVSLLWKHVRNAARDRGISAARFAEDPSPSAADAHAGRRVIRLLHQFDLNLDAILLIRDQDDQPERRIGLEQARADTGFPTPIVIGLAIRERESWVLAGFDPEDDAETTRLAEQRQKLGFDPRLRSHDLTARDRPEAKRNPKQVLRSLTGGDEAREQRCWQEIPLATLADRGEGNGLVAFLDEVEFRLAPLIGSNPRPWRVRAETLT